MAKVTLHISGNVGIDFAKRQVHIPCRHELMLEPSMLVVPFHVLKFAAAKIAEAEAVTENHQLIEQRKVRPGEMRVVLPGESGAPT